MDFEAMDKEAEIEDQDPGLSLRYWRVTCESCDQGYDQGGYKPTICGACGSDKITLEARSWS